MTYDKLLNHVGHKLECVFYAYKSEVWNVAVECVECHEVLCDADKNDDFWDPRTLYEEEF